LKIYTRSGDGGQTSLIGARVRKDDVRVEAYGTLDELNAFVGMALTALDDERFADLRDDLTAVQHELFDCGSDLAYADPGRYPYKTTAAAVERLEARIDYYTAELAPIRRFILPGGSPASSLLHVCRTVCRRAERRAVALAERHAVNEQVIRYLNRLSDFLFTAARTANARLGVRDVEYVRGAEVFRTGDELL
jgi:cob(I)alamin adenosyltransferase